MNEQPKKPTHYTTGINGEVVPVYSQAIDEDQDATVNIAGAASPEESQSLHYTTKTDGSAILVDGGSTFTESSKEKSAVTNLKNEPKVEPENQADKAAVVARREEASVQTEPEFSPPEAKIKENQQRELEEKASDGIKGLNKPEEDNAATEQRTQEVRSATKLVEPNALQPKKTSKWVKVGAGVAAVGALIGGVAFANNKTDNGPGQETSSSAEANNKSPEQQQALTSEGKKIIKNLDTRATAYLGDVSRSDKAAWDQAFILAAADPDQAAKILADSGSSKQLFDLAVVLNENVWTPGYTNAVKKILAVTIGSEIDFSVNAETVKNYLMKTGVYDKLPVKTNEDSVTSYSMYQTINSMGGIEFATEGKDYVKQYLRDTQQGNINIAPTYVQNGYLTQTEANALVQGTEQYISNVDTKLDAVMQD